jgi:alcohol dehydrogenase class IV
MGPETGRLVDQKVVDAESRLVDRHPPDEVVEFALILRQVVHGVSPCVLAWRAGALDAFAHAMESYLSPKSTLFSEKAALFAASEIFDVISQLPSSYDEEMRARLSLAATAGGMAISVTGTGFPHPLGYAITMLDGIPHGAACAVFEGDYIEYNMKSPIGKIKLLEFAEAHETTVEYLAKRLTELSGVNLSFTEEEIARRVELIADAKNYVNSPYVISKDEMYEIYRKHFLA